MGSRWTNNTTQKRKLEDPNSEWLLLQWVAAAAALVVQVQSSLIPEAESSFANSSNILQFIELWRQHVMGLESQERLTLDGLKLIMCYSPQKRKEL